MEEERRRRAVANAEERRRLGRKKIPPSLGSLPSVFQAFGVGTPQPSLVQTSPVRRGTQGESRSQFDRKPPLGDKALFGARLGPQHTPVLGPRLPPEPRLPATPSTPKAPPRQRASGKKSARHLPSLPAVDSSDTGSSGRLFAPDPKRRRLTTFSEREAAQTPRAPPASRSTQSISTGFGGGPPLSKQTPRHPRSLSGGPAITTPSQSSSLIVNIQRLSESESSGVMPLLLPTGVKRKRMLQESLDTETAESTQQFGPAPLLVIPETETQTEAFVVEVPETESETQPQPMAGGLPPRIIPSLVPEDLESSDFSSGSTLPRRKRLIELSSPELSSSSQTTRMRTDARRRGRLPPRALPVFRKRATPVSG